MKIIKRLFNEVDSLSSSDLKKLCKFLFVFNIISTFNICIFILFS